MVDLSGKCGKTADETLGRDLKFLFFSANAFPFGTSFLAPVELGAEFSFPFVDYAGGKGGKSQKVC